MAISHFDRLQQNVSRVGEILAVLAKYGLAGWVSGLKLPWLLDRFQSVDAQPVPMLEPGQRMRLALTELGTTFIKLGQVLSTRPDLVGPDIAKELAHLQTDTPADPPELVRGTIEAEFGRPLADLFAHFELEPFASASIAQVHVARLHTGETVVVKVQHPGIAERSNPDLDILASLAALAETQPRLRLYQPVALVRQFRRTFLLELDFAHELRNVGEFSQNFLNDDTVRFPLTYPKLSSHRVLTMARLDGILGTDAAALRTSGEDLGEFARRGANVYLQMIFRDGFYHADPHPGNLMLLPGGVVGVLDCGMVGRLDEALVDAADEVLIALVNGDSAALEEVISRVGVSPTTTTHELLRAELADFVADYLGQSIEELDLIGAINNLFGIVRRHKITLPPAFTLLLRTLIELEGTAQRLSPDFSLAEVFPKVYPAIVLRRLSVGRFLARLQHNLRDWERLFGGLPRDLGEVLQRLRDGTFSVHLDLRHLDPVVNRVVLGLLTSALLVSSALLWSMRAPPTCYGVSVLGALGYLLSAGLALRLLVAVGRASNAASKR